jgi:crotonobetainyl-CoA:carnitine CoA-transferase CaiB-like acyl-CoA transferase
LIEDRFRTHTAAEVTDWLTHADIPTGAMNDVPAVAAHPQLAARQRWATVDSPGGPIPALLPPHNLQHAPPRMGAVPALGEHSAEIRAELGS